MSGSMDSTSIQSGGVQTWPVVTVAAVTAKPLPMEATAKAPPHPGPPPRERERGSDSAGVGNDAATPNSRPQANSLSSARGGEGRGEGATEAGQANGQAAASKTSITSASVGTAVLVAAKPTTSSQTAQPAVFAHPQTGAGMVGTTIVTLLLVIGFILLLAWLAKRMPGVSGAGNSALKVVGSLSLGPRERVVVVAVGDTQLLLSTGPNGTRALHTLEQPLPTAPASASPFAQVLAQQFGKKKS